MQAPPKADLAIDPATVRLFVAKAKAVAADLDLENLDQSADTVEFDIERLEDSHHHDGLAEEETEDLTSVELQELIDDLNDDEAASLVAIVWVGRGDFEASDFATAVSEARDRAEGATSTYLLGMPLLADYLDSGLDALGH
ncbi:MAG: DUF3775 domain-containing protein [Devosiaceae bacterium]|nr:DUF3775 domain-containing protein [Devosiaceae bacterium MH13]